MSLNINAFILGLTDTTVTKRTARPTPPTSTGNVLFLILCFLIISLYSM